MTVGGDDTAAMIVRRVESAAHVCHGLFLVSFPSLYISICFSSLCLFRASGIRNMMLLLLVYPQTEFLVSRHKFSLTIC